MSLLPAEAGYLEQVQAYFLAFRGAGVSLSPLDAELLHEWALRGVPTSVIFRGIRREAERVLRRNGPGGRLRTLRSCRPSVERELLRYEGIAAGRGADAPENPSEDYGQKRLKKAQAALRKALREPPGAARDGLERALAMLEPAGGGDSQDVAARIARADETLAVLFVRRLPYAARVAVVRRARESAGPKPPGASPRARKDALRAHLVAIARSEGDLISLA